MTPELPPRKYDTIGIDYALLRKPDPRIAAYVDAGLKGAQTILNVGAGAGSYEPENKQITAVEPSAKMIAQRPASDALVIQGYAEDLPFADNSFDAAMAILTIHHWSDQHKGVSEMRRVTRGNIVFVTYDPAFRDFWLLDYFPELAALDDGQMPSMKNYTKWLGPVKISNIPIPHDCQDGFLAAYWRRPSAYLDARIRAAISSFWALENMDDGLRRLEADLTDGAWHKRYGHLLDLTELDCGYRLVESL